MTSRAGSPINSEALKAPLETLLALAKKAGADTADAVATHGRSLSIGVRGGQIEDVDSSEGRDVGLRVILGKKQACVSTSDLSKASLEMLAERAVAMARLAPDDGYCGLAPSAVLERAPENLNLFDPTILNPEDLKIRALELEAAALSVKGVSQAEGAGASATSSAIYFATSDGFASGWRSSRFNMSVLAIAEQDGAMERDYDYDGGRWLEDVKDPSLIGKKAGERAIARLGASQLKSGKMAVIFDRRVAASLVSALTGAISGPAISRGVSFLKDALGEPVFGKNIIIIDDPLIARGHGSRPWDGEGVRVSRRKIIDNGTLTTWLLNSASARQLGLETTGHAYRNIGSPPGVASTNMILQNGDDSPAALMANMGEGLLVTDMFGPSLNSNTGDYSVGVSGFKISGGVITTPVSEVTVAGNLIDIFPNIIAANDLTIDGATASPSLLLGELTVAGA
ncbi:MAG: TldD/PmbA family protein [Robiginitomaculum sp.]